MLTYAIASKQNSSPIKIKERERKKKNTKVMLLIFYSILKLTVKVNLLFISLWVVEYYPHHRWMIGQGGVHFIITYSKHKNLTHVPIIISLEQDAVMTDSKQKAAVCCKCHA